MEEGAFFFFSFQGLLIPCGTLDLNHILTAVSSFCLLELEIVLGSSYYMPQVLWKLL